MTQARRLRLVKEEEIILRCAYYTEMLHRINQ